MSVRIIFSSIVALFFLQSCSTPQQAENANSIFWVSGYKTEASAGAGKMQVLNVHRGEDLANPNWENFYAPIKGFEFEEGYLQKIEVSEKELDSSEVPADASSIEYTLIEVLDKQKDNRVELAGQWMLVKLNDAPLNRMVAVPTLQVDLTQKQISGNAGCNNFSGSIKALTNTSLELGQIASTKKMCVNKNIETEFLAALNDIHSFDMQGSTLTFLNEGREKVLAFIKDEKTSANTRLHDIWVATRIDGNPINRMSAAPSLELNLTTMQVMGNNGCNEYTGEILKVTASELSFGPIAATEKMCKKMDIADKYDAAITQVASYRLEGLNLMLFDSEGKEVLAFLKVD
ncbi:MAG: META domain-containing protein [Bacteroidetes bacterium]|nr:META domain-containing protein [Bacteroidota bacterium]